ncbi:hypothetical protein LXL04_037252 [Taraxacum kok-saghyz]
MVSHYPHNSFIKETDIYDKRSPFRMQKWEVPIRLKSRFKIGCIAKFKVLILDQNGQQKEDEASVLEEFAEEFRLPIHHRPTENVDLDNVQQASLDTL